MKKKSLFLLSRAVVKGPNLCCVEARLGSELGGPLHAASFTFQIPCGVFSAGKGFGCF